MRLDLSGGTVTSRVATTANVLVDGGGVPIRVVVSDRVGVLLSLNSQTVCFLLGGVAARGHRRGHVNPEGPR